MRAPVSYSFAVLFYLCVFKVATLAEDGSKGKIKSRDRVVMWTTLVLILLMITFAMVNHMIMVTLYGSEGVVATYNIREALYQITYIGGVQGRYLMPFFPLAFLQIGSLELMNKKTTQFFMIFVLIITYFYVTYILIERFWI